MSLLLAYFALASAAAFLAFWRDKNAAGRGGRRVSEARLLTLAALGGTPGAKLAQGVLRHKTRKQPFRRQLDLIMALQIAVGIVALVFWLRAASL